MSYLKNIRNCVGLSFVAENVPERRKNAKRYKGAITK